MKRISLSCFEGFACKADRCRDNCCIGWEIDIDEDTLEKYRNYQGVLKERFESCIDYGETPHFILGEKGRCPFLNEHNLCDIILREGEDMLCEICGKHPRFYEWLPGYTFEGYGIGCEQAAEMVLFADKPISFTETDIPDFDEADEADDKSRIVLDVLKTAASLVQREGFDMAHRMMLLLAFGSGIQNAVEAEEPEAVCHIIGLYSNGEYLQKLCDGFERFATDSWQEYHHEIIDIYRRLENLDERWHRHLALLYDEFDVVADVKTEGDRQKIWENMAIYLLFRHLPAAFYDEDFLARIKLVVMSFLTIGLLMGAYLYDRQAKMAAMYSKEIEYSDENIGQLLDESYVNEALSVPSLMAVLLRVVGIYGK